MNNTTTIVLAAALASALGGCGNRYLSPRPTNPFIEDRVTLGDSANGKMSVLTSRADRRTILVFGPRNVCAEPPPDVAEAVYSQTVATLANKGINVAAGSTLQTALMQLTRRSQGLDFFRTGAFVNCMMHYNGVLDATEYRQAMTDLLQRSTHLTELEMANLPTILATVAQVENAQAVTLPNNYDPKAVGEGPEVPAKEGGE